MKSFLFALPVFFATTVSAQNKSLSAVLNSYYKVKNELVADNSSTAAVAAAEFKTAVATVDHSTLTAADLKPFEPVKQKIRSRCRNHFHIKRSQKTTGSVFCIIKQYDRFGKSSLVIGERSLCGLLPHEKSILVKRGKGH